MNLLNPLINCYNVYRILAAGDSLQSIAFAYRIGKSTACTIFNETCLVLWDVLQGLYVAPPTSEKWVEIEQEFKAKWQLPNCVGAIDGKHVTIKAPNKSGSLFFNYKKNFSIVLFAICDANYLFTYVDIGAYGSQSDGGVLRSSSFGYNLRNGHLNLPDDKPLPGTVALKIPYFFVGDEAFPLERNLMRPFGGRFLPEDKRIFNYRLSRARRCIENAFGILAARWNIYRKTIYAYPENVDNIVKATIVLHNYIKTEERRLNPIESRYCADNFVDEELANGDFNPGEWRAIQQNNALQPAAQLRRIGSRNAADASIKIRNYIKDYLMGIGSVDWQLEYIRR